MLVCKCRCLADDVFSPVHRRSSHHQAIPNIELLTYSDSIVKGVCAPGRSRDAHGLMQSRCTNDNYGKEESVLLAASCLEHLKDPIMWQNANRSSRAALHTMVVNLCLCVCDRLAGRAVGSTGGAAVGEKWGGPRLHGS